MTKAPKRRKEPLPEDLDTFASRLHEDSDRGAGLVACALLDAQLEDLFRRRLKHNLKELLAPEGALGTFAGRIRLARALEWIDDDTEHDLHRVREIRNRLAHSFDQALGFDDQQIADWCRNLRTMNAHIAAFDDVKDLLHRNYSLSLIAKWRALFEPPRSRYLLTTHFIAQHLKEAVDSGGNEMGLIESVTVLAKRSPLR